MQKLKSFCPRSVSAAELQLQIERLKRVAPTVNWEAGPRKKAWRRMPIEQAIRRFWERVDTSGDCWLWTGKCTPRGYGKVVIRQIIFLAHRMSYVLTNGQIPRGLCVCHHCDVRSCVNPNHLWLGTNLDNARDMVAKGRSPKGEACGWSKLSEAQVLEIVRRYENETASSLAEEFGVSMGAIFSIVGGHNWTWLTKISAHV